MKRVLTYHVREQSGQVLLATIMLLAIVITVAFTAIFTSGTSTRTTKLEQESDKALAAAEAGIQAALQKGGSVSFGQESLSDFGDFSGNASVVTNASRTTFTTPAMEQDEMYTFYMGTYTAGLPPTIGPSISENLTICFGSGSTVPALDVAIMKDATATNRVVRLAIDPQGRIANASNATSGCSGAPSGTTYTHSYTIPAATIGTNTKLIAVRVLYGKTMLFFRRPTSVLPSQGVIVESTATSNDTNVTKKVRVFESYPQIPADIFSLTY